MVWWLQGPIKWISWFILSTSCPKLTLTYQATLGPSLKLALQPWATLFTQKRFVPTDPQPFNNVWRHFQHCTWESWCDNYSYNETFQSFYQFELVRTYRGKSFFFQAVHVKTVASIKQGFLISFDKLFAKIPLSPQRGPQMSWDKSTVQITNVHHVTLTLCIK